MACVWRIPFSCRGRSVHLPRRGIIADGSPARRAMRDISSCLRLAAERSLSPECLTQTHIAHGGHRGLWFLCYRPSPCGERVVFATVKIEQLLCRFRCGLTCYVSSQNRPIASLALASDHPFFCALDINLSASRPSRHVLALIRHSLILTLLGCQTLMRLPSNCTITCKLRHNERA